MLLNLLIIEKSTLYRNNLKVSTCILGYQKRPTQGFDKYYYKRHKTSSYISKDVPLLKSFIKTVPKTIISLLNCALLISNNGECNKFRFYVFGSGLSVVEVTTRVHWVSKPIVIVIGLPFYPHAYNPCRLHKKRFLLDLIY